LTREKPTENIKNIQNELENNSKLTKSEIKELQYKQEYFENLQQKNIEIIQQLESIQKGFQQELAHNKEVLNILVAEKENLDSKVHFNEKEISRLTEFSQQSKERFSNLEKKQAEFEKQLA
jgi:transcription antitermination factor NusA-like protein